MKYVIPLHITQSRATCILVTLPNIIFLGVHAIHGHDIFQPSPFLLITFINFNTTTPIVGYTLLRITLVYRARPFLALVLYARGKGLAKVTFGMQLIKTRKT